MVNVPETKVEELDLRGLKCPFPALFAKRALLRTPAGTIIEVVADDPLAAVDIPHMCAHESFVVLASRRDGELVKLKLQRPTVAAAAPRSDQDG